MAFSVALRVEKLSRAYPTGAGVREVSFALEKGEIGALVGPNGSGKTTLLDALIGQSPHSGEVWILGQKPEDPAARRVHLAYLPEDRGLPPFLTGRTAARLAEELWRSPGYLERFERERRRWGLDDAALSQPAAVLSQGTREKLSLALLFAREAAVYVLDEPEAHLDPIVRAELEVRMMELKKEGKTVLFATHDVHLAVRLGDRVFAIHSGRVRELRMRSPEAILAALKGGEGADA